jgi:hypothetical protein
MDHEQLAKELSNITGIEVDIVYRVLQAETDYLFTHGWTDEDE